MCWREAFINNFTHNCHFCTAKLRKQKKIEHRKLFFLQLLFYIIKSPFRRTVKSFFLRGFRVPPNKRRAKQAVRNYIIPRCLLRYEQAGLWTCESKVVACEGMPWCFALVESKHDACRNTTEFAVANSVLAKTIPPEKCVHFPVLAGTAPRSLPCKEKYIIFQPVCP